MKGVLFTEFLDFVAATHGADAVDDIIEDSALPSGGSYTSVGTYDHQELMILLDALVRRTGGTRGDLLVRYGKHLGQIFARKYASFFDKESLFDFLRSVDDHIHVEVHKLYPDAELPAFRTHAMDGKRMELDYRSLRRLEALAEGLILSAAEHYKTSVRVTRSQMEDAAGPFVRFTIDIEG